MEVGEADVHLKDLFSPEYCDWVGVDSSEEALAACKKELIEKGYDWPSSTLQAEHAEEERTKLMRRTTIMQRGNVRFHERVALGGSWRRQNHLTKCGCSVPHVFTPGIVSHDWYGQCQRRGASFQQQSIAHARINGIAEHIVDTLKELRQRLELTPASTPASGDAASASADCSEAVAIASSSASNISADDDGDPWAARNLVIEKALEATDAILADDLRESCRELRPCVTTYEEAAVQFDAVNPAALELLIAADWSGPSHVKPRRCFSALSWLHVSSPSWLTSKRALRSNMNRSTFTRSGNSA